MEPLLGLVVATAVSMALIPLMWRVAPALGLIDEPDPRKVHKAPIPRVGGWGIVGGTLLPIVAFLPLDHLVTSYVVATLVLFVFGVWDDARNIGHYKKFIGQIVAVTFVVFYGGLWIERVPYIDAPMPPALGIPFTYVAIIGMINAINHSDGLDGLAGGESLLSLLTIGFLCYSVDGSIGTAITITAAGGVLGFLRYNTHPARVFMGDAGSQFLGFTLAFMAILLTQKINPVLSPAVTLLFLGLPIIDIIAVLYLRISGGMNWFKATRNHIHHRLLDLGFSHTAAVVIIYGIHTALVLAAIVMRHESDYLITALYLGVAVTIFAVLTWAERTGWHKERPTRRRSIEDFLDSTRSMRLFNRYPYYAMVILVPALLLYQASSAVSVPRDFAVTSGVLALVLAIELVSKRTGPTFISRGVVYVAIVFATHLGGVGAGDDTHRLVFVSGLVILALLIAMSIRFSDDGSFRTTTMDYLILAAVALFAVGGQRLLEFSQVAEVVTSAVLLLYAGEIIIERSGHRLNLLNLAALAALGWFATRGWSSPRRASDVGPARTAPGHRLADRRESRDGRSFGHGGGSGPRRHLPPTCRLRAPPPPGAEAPRVGAKALARLRGRFRR